MLTRADLPPKPASSSDSYVLDFVDSIPAGSSISTQSVTASVYSGTDASPSAIISGSATASGTQVTQKVTGGTVGVIYQLTWTVTTSGGLTLKKLGFLAIVPDLV
jgi:hypothetical protein